MRIAELQLRNADKLYIDGKIDEAKAAVDDIVVYSEKARDTANESRKHLKNVEIAVRKIAEKLRTSSAPWPSTTSPRSTAPSSAWKISVPHCSKRCSRRRRNEAEPIRVS